MTELVDWGTPAFAAGLEEDDVILTADGKPFDSFKSRKPGETVLLSVKRPTGRTASLKLVLGEDPLLKRVPIESAGGKLSPGQKAFRNSWLGSKVPSTR